MQRRQYRGVVTLFAFLAIPVAPGAADVTGHVRHADTLVPVSGAIVSLQASDVRTTTAPDGGFSLPLSSGTDLVIVAGAKGFFYAWKKVSPPLAGLELLLPPVPPMDDPAYTFLEPFDCGNCHPDQHNQWSDTPMARAGFNTWVDDIYSGQGTPGGMGGFVYTRDSVFAGSNPESECAACHQPEHWVNSPFTALADPTLPRPRAVTHGISCEVCHKIADVDESKINFPGLFPGALTFSRPAGPNFHQVQYGVLGDVTFSGPSLMRPSYQPQLVAEVCGTCHQDKNDPDENHTYNGVTSEPTYTEWAESPYGDEQSPLYETCVDCHMPPSGATEVCVVLYPPLVRDPDTIRSHTILGTTPEFLENAVDMVMDTAIEGSELRVNVAITNSRTGHHVPTGVTVRNMILVLEAWKDGDDPLIAPLLHTGLQTVHALGGEGSPAAGYYGGMAGKLYAKVNHNAEGNGPTFFTDATGLQFDTRIPALATDNTSYTFALPNEGGTVHVRARLIYRRAFRFLVDAKQWTETGHGNPLEDVLPPHFGHLKEIAEANVVAPVQMGACCLADEGCAVVSEAECLSSLSGTWAGPGTDCNDANGDGLAHACDTRERIPTVSSWGVVIMALLFAVGSRLLTRRRRPYPWGL